jgi:hypothetical protein
MSETTVGGGGVKNVRVTQWSRSLVVKLVLQVRQDPDPESDHVVLGQTMHSVLFALENVPAVQFMQRFVVSGSE